MKNLKKKLKDQLCYLSMDESQKDGKNVVITTVGLLECSKRTSYKFVAVIKDGKAVRSFKIQTK